MGASTAGAVVVDFANEADTNGERGENFGALITIDGVTMNLFASQGITPGGFGPAFPTANPYFDAGNAGLGVCKVLTQSRQCSPASDDNVTEGEAVALVFREADGFTTKSFHIEDLTFRDANHNLIDENNNGLIRIVSFATDRALLDMTATFTDMIAMAMAGDALFRNVFEIQFYFENKQFYLSAMELSEVPIPGALPLLLSGLAGISFASRRKKAAQAA